jgi:hypothetical protein
MPGSQGLDGAKPIFFRRPFRTAPGLPEPMSHGGSVLLPGFVSGRVGAIPGSGVPKRVLWV